MSQHAQQLRDGLVALRLDLNATQQQSLLQYAELLRKWNRVYSLTALTDPDVMVSHHLLDSLAALAPISADVSLRVLDVGSGGGQPGIPFAIARPDWRLVLLDSNQKKTTFLRQAVIELGLANVEVVCSRVEQYQPAQRFDVITSRAFADTADFVGLTRHLLAATGKWAALKGVAPREEIAAIPPALGSAHVVPLQVPGLAAERCLVLVQPPRQSQEEAA